jgi:hypothetical protein
MSKMHQVKVVAKLKQKAKARSKHDARQMTPDFIATYKRHENRCYEKCAHHTRQRSNGKKVKGHMGR